MAANQTLQNVSVILKNKSLPEIISNRETLTQNSR
jgi:hypothetical protein